MSAFNPSPFPRDTETRQGGYLWDSSTPWHITVSYQWYQSKLEDSKNAHADPYWPVTSRLFITWNTLITFTITVQEQKSMEPGESTLPWHCTYLITTPTTFLHFTVCNYSTAETILKVYKTPSFISCTENILEICILIQFWSGQNIWSDRDEKAGFEIYIYIDRWSHRNTCIWKK